MLDPATTNTAPQPAHPLADAISRPGDSANMPSNGDVTGIQPPPPPTYASVPPQLPSSAAYPQAASAGEDGSKPATRATAPATADGAGKSACSSCMWFYNCSALGFCCGWCCVECIKCFSS